MLRELEAWPVVAVGLEFPAGAERDALAVPAVAGLAVAVRDVSNSGLTVARFALDLRVPEVRAALAAALGSPCLVVVHDVIAAFIAIKNLGLSRPRAFFDTRLAAQLLSLGKHHPRYAWAADDPQCSVRAAEARENASLLSHLAAVHGVALTGSRDAAGALRNMLSREPGGPIGVMNAEAITSGAFLALALHPCLRLGLLEAGVEWHHDHIELPAAIAFAEMERAGVTVDLAQMDRAQYAARKAVAFHETELKKHGFKNPRSHEDRVRVCRALGVLERFDEDGSYSFEERKLKAHRDAHPVVDLLYRHTKYARILDDRLLDGSLVGDDGRVHPNIEPLGADSGRPSFRNGNLPGVGKIIRPIVIPDFPEHGLVEFDFKQQEPMIAAAHFGDAQLLADCNGGDLYIRMVRGLRADDLSPSQLSLDDDDLAATRNDLREEVKVFVFKLLYGGRPGTRGERERFFRRYPDLKRGIERAIKDLRSRGYAEVVTGIKRFRGKTGPLLDWEENWAVNTPIQGGGACILKLALPRLQAFLAEHGGRVVLAIYDAVLIQVRLVDGQVQQHVVDGAKKIMIEAMRELYPATEPRIDVNGVDTSCWNKDGHSDSIESFLKDPTFKL